MATEALHALCTIIFTTFSRPLRVSYCTTIYHGRRRLRTGGGKSLGFVDVWDWGGGGVGYTMRILDPSLLTTYRGRKIKSRQGNGNWVHEDFH